MRGSIDTIVQSVFGPNATTLVEPAKPEHKGYDADAYARISVRHGDTTTLIGGFGLISDAALKAHELEHPLVGAELTLATLIDAYPPKSHAEMLPQFPGIERDLSLIVPESTRWSAIESLAAELALDKCVGWELVGIFRGKQLGDGKKSVTLRLRFRDDERTLRHEEVDPQVDLFAAKAKDTLGAEIRTAG
jgi:phenylalanyl-tRNA synthetase beta chain